MQGSGCTQVRDGGPVIGGSPVNFLVQLPRLTTLNMGEKVKHPHSFAPFWAHEQGPQPPPQLLTECLRWQPTGSHACSHMQWR